MVIPHEARKQMLENFRACVHKLPVRNVKREDWITNVDTHEQLVALLPTYREAIQRVAVMQQHLWNQQENNRTWAENQVSKIKALIEELKP